MLEVSEKNTFIFLIENMFKVFLKTSHGIEIPELCLNGSHDVISALFCHLPQLWLVFTSPGAQLLLFWGVFLYTL